MKKIYTVFGLAVVDIVLLGVMRNIDGAAQWYSSTIYPFWVNTLGQLCGLVPFSVVEMLLYIVVILAGIWFLRFLRRVFKKQQDAAAFLRKGLVNALLFVTILFTMYVVTCGINYYKDSFADTYGMEKQAYTDEELEAACRILAERINEFAGSVPRDDDGIMRVSKDAEKTAVAVMRELGNTYDKLSGFYPIPKGLTVSWILSVQSLTGVYSPFTVEANFNQAMTDYNQPFTMCHELSHLKGFMQEEEANFIAFLACEQAEDVEFRYSSAVMGWIYCGNELYRRNPEKYREVAQFIPREAWIDIDDNSKFWETYEGVISEASEKVNDTYLKANRQENGVESYDMVADLIVQHLNRDYEAGK